MAKLKEKGDVRGDSAGSQRSGHFSRYISVYIGRGGASEWTDTRLGGVLRELHTVLLVLRSTEEGGEETR